MTRGFERGNTVRPVIFCSRRALFRGLLVVSFVFTAAGSAPREVSPPTDRDWAEEAA